MRWGPASAPVDAVPDPDADADPVADADAGAVAAADARADPLRCASCRAKQPHHMKIVDWELAQQFRRLQRACSSIDEALQKLRDNWLGNLCGSDKDTHLFVGNMQAHPGTFLVLGVFWPPKRPQLGLFGS